MFVNVKSIMGKAAYLREHLLLIALLLFLFSPLYPVFAQNDSTPSAGSRRDVEARLQQIKDRIASRQAELKAKLNKFRDQKKAEIAQRVSDNLNMINKKRTSEMGFFLDKMSNILDRVEKKASESASASSSAQPAVVSARQAINTARTAVTNQSIKDYTLTVTSESKVRIDAKADRDRLFSDLKATRELVIAAKQAVAKAIAALASAGGNS